MLVGNALITGGDTTVCLVNVTAFPAVTLCPVSAGDATPRKRGLRIRQWILYGLGAVVAAVSAFVIFGIFGSSNTTGSNNDPGLSQKSRSDLEALPYCAVAREYGVPVEVLAGVVLAEKQLNRQLFDAVQDEIFKIMLWIFGDRWWDHWANRSLDLAAQNENERLSAPEWSPLVKATGITFSIGPAQITPRTALAACEQMGRESPVCAGSTKSLIAALMSPEKSLEVAAVVLKAEQRNQLRLTGLDVTDSPGKWATLYNFGGDIFRSLFAGELDRGPNSFGRWVDHNAAQIRALTSCAAS